MSAAEGTATTTRVKVRTKHDPPRPYLRAGFGWNGQWQAKDVDDATLAILRADPHLRVELANATDASFPEAAALADLATQNEALRDENAKLRHTVDGLTAERDKLQSLLDSVTLPSHDAPRAPTAKPQRERHAG